MGVVVEGTGNKYIKVRIPGFTGCSDKVGAGNGTEFGANENGGPFLYS